MLGGFLLQLGYTLIVSLDQFTQLLTFIPLRQVSQLCGCPAPKVLQVLQRFLRLQGLLGHQPELLPRAFDLLVQLVDLLM
ncbi:hypothetical protein D3C76_719410 [compost metagenome]